MDTFQIREELFFGAPCGEIRIPTQDGSKFEAANPNQRVQMLELMPNKLTTYHTSNSRYIHIYIYI